MDHNAQLSKMDPKLKEAYERVMGTSGTHSSPPQQPAQITQAPFVAAKPSPSQTPPPKPVSDEIPRMEVPLRRSAETVHFGGGVSAKAVHTSLPVLTTAKPRKKGGISPAIIIGVLGVFFVIYTVFWARILAVPIPFLSP